MRFIFEPSARIASHLFALQELDGAARAGGGRRSVMGWCTRCLRRAIMKWTLGEINAADLPNLVNRKSNAA